MNRSKYFDKVGPLSALLEYVTVFPRVRHFIIRKSSIWNKMFVTFGNCYGQIW